MKLNKCWGTTFCISFDTIFQKKKIKTYKHGGRYSTCPSTAYLSPFIKPVSPIIHNLPKQGNFHYHSHPVIATLPDQPFPPQFIRVVVVVVKHPENKCTQLVSTSTVPPTTSCSSSSNTVARHSRKNKASSQQYKAGPHSHEHLSRRTVRWL